MAYPHGPTSVGVILLPPAAVSLSEQSPESPPGPVTEPEGLYDEQENAMYFFRSHDSLLSVTSIDQAVFSGILQTVIKISRDVIL